MVRRGRLLGLTVVLVARAGLGADQPGCSGNAAVPNRAENCPDRFAWEKFIEVNTPVAGGLVTFQTYSTDGDTFQCPPADLATCSANPGAKGCPVWPAAPTGGYSTAAAQLNQRTARLGTAGPGAFATRPAHQSGFDCWAFNGNNVEVVYRNRATFDYIVQNGLWYVEGVEEAFERGLVYSFPIAAMEVKANWLPLTADQVSSGRYYTMTQGGQTLGLVAMHISTKDLPNWFWSTFEHVDNPGRCDFLGCHDSFGYTPHDVPSRPRQLCEAYPPEQITPALEAMIAKLPPVFRNYRLKGSMVDFTTATGSPILLGNSVTEAGFVPTASCMTCHSRAAVQATAGPPLGLSPYPYVAGFTPNGQSYNGTPDPEWFYSGNDPLQRYAVQTDFVWAIPFKANSLYSTAACCAAGGQCQCQAAGTCNAPQ